VSRRRLSILLLAVLLLAGAGGLVYFAYSPAGDSRPHPFNHDRNAIWLEHRWLERAHSEEEMEALFRKLRARGITYAYPHLIPFGADGTLPPHSREQMRAFLLAARRVAPELRILPWVGGLRVGYKRQREGTISLSERALARLRELGAGGTLVSLTHERAHAAAVVLFLAAGK